MAGVGSQTFTDPLPSIQITIHYQIPARQNGKLRFKVSAHELHVDQAFLVCTFVTKQHPVLTPRMLRANQHESTGRAQIPIPSNAIVGRMIPNIDFNVLASQL
ncbi:hypothetical protein A7326_16825 [Stenotrophomonas maltophilia]|nr:hypothetical protein A7326_16825 [Stenotrophomonas maltophilia]